MRFLWTAVLLLVAGVAGMLAWGSLENLWSDYRDSETSTYLLIGIPSVLVALTALYGVARVWRDGSR
jgi:succinate dehydrogenase hydrophobic anchor subunit